VKISCSRDGCSPESPCQVCVDRLEEATVAAFLRRRFGYCTEEMLHEVLDALHGGSDA
jgi:mRNA-degrading endonuclease toxin of MazEF toxin-antitoxin module